ncbi:class I adenylate-forming enzyme family protein [Hazenella coriacea]|uniref:O-succinylbenzoate-CoA ligase n=1 Tax=Hazenella coriacea TaxID=1179467 RepID=A0A4R3LA32_9BACL|nr:long-chain-fatty-acid--CoA ligase [Hazenella coriacea]TCS96579.1 O-succinylbenzoate-CoA ligase [Hazenella coriacea]
MSIIGEILENRANVSPNLEALVCDYQRYTYRDFNETSNQVAHYLLEIGVKKGDRVAILCKNSPHFAFIMLAILKIGAIFVPLNWRLKADEIHELMKDSKPKVLFYDEEYSQSITYSNEWYFVTHRILTCKGIHPHPTYEALFSNKPITNPEVHLHQDDPAVIVYTSGTTGKPKGVVCSHHNIFTTGTGGTLLTNPSYADRFLLITPLFHISGVTGIMNMIYYAITLVMKSQFDSSRILEYIEQEKITSTMGVPPILIYLLPEIAKTERDLSSLKYFSSGGTKVPLKLIEQYQSFGYPIIQAYGATEVAGGISCWVPYMGMDKCQSVGKPVMFAKIKIVDPDTGKELPAGEIGEIIIKGPQVFKGYWNNAEETKKALQDGWFYTGDAGKKDEDGFLYVIDRYKDVIICGGEKVYPAEVEAVISELDDVLEVSLVGTPNEIWGEMPCACIVKKEGSEITEEDVLSYCKEKLANYKVTQVRFMDELPKNSLGKVIKTALREQTSSE